MADPVASALDAVGLGWLPLDTTDVIVLTVVLCALVYLAVSRLMGSGDAASKRASVASAATLPTVDSEDWLSRMKRTGKKVAVFFGSQTGTAEEYATRLVKDARSYGLKAMVVDMQDADFETFTTMAEEVPDALAVFCVATYGEGDPTDNAQDFWDALRSAVDEGEDGPRLGGLNYAVFGLGNRTYEQFNEVGRVMDKAFADLGGKRVVAVGEGDDNDDIEEDFSQWCDRLWAAACERYGIDPDAVAEDTQRQYSIELVGAPASGKVFAGEPFSAGSYDNQRRPYTLKNPYLAPIVCKQELFQDAERSCLHIELGIKGSGIRYCTGDHVAVLPQNAASLVGRLGKRLGVDLDQLFVMTALEEDVKKQRPFPCPCSFRTALTHYVDITSLPKPHLLRALADHTDDATAKEFLLRITSKEGKKEYGSWVVRTHRTLIHVLEELPSVNPPTDLLLELLPRLQPRYYSISSSPKRHPDAIHITASVVRFHSALGNRIDGVCTSWLESLNPGTDRVPIFVRSSTFRLPMKQSTPVVMVGPGTGLAPFRGFVQERHYVKEKGVPVGDTMLFFGCQNKDKHFLYRDELEGYHADGAISHLELAFSRDGPEKVYVQHKLKAAGKEVFTLLKDKRGHLYVCGDAKNMARDVSRTITEIAQEHGGMTEQQAVNWAKDLRKRKRYSEDVWS